ncbi:MAG: class I SAM-dependent methyltransferase [Verrucomicrobiales bacterium]|nr:class I SAM-dependent methyltransferase [Verrucomicrobiales bacterium]
MATDYDRVPYPCHAHPQTHPAHLAVMARLRGMRPAAPEACRFLEIGCGDGGNLMPMALEYPGSQFLGIDLAESSIERARQSAARFGTSQVEFRAQDIMDLKPGELGQWDYVVAHGVFSWVPEPVRLRLLAVCRELLAPDGVAYISYNAYPGAHLRAIPREMMLYHTKKVAEPEVRVAQARELMRLVAENQSGRDAVSAIVLSEANRVLDSAPNLLTHDDLSPDNQAYYLHEFAALAAERGLQCLGDADYASMFGTRYPAGIRQALARLGDDDVRREQYLDFLSCRRFRQSLLCRAEIKRERQAPLAAIKECFFSSSAKTASPESQLLDDSPVTFLGESDLRGEVSAPIPKLILAALGRNWPARLRFQDLRAVIATAIGSAVPSDAVAGALRDLIEMGAAHVHHAQIRHATTVSERPRVWDWARYQQTIGTSLTSLRHHTIQISDAFGIWLVGQLDGTQTAEAIAQKHALAAKPGPDGKLDAEKALRKARKRVASGIEKLVQFGFVPPDDPGGS